MPKMLGVTTVEKLVIGEMYVSIVFHQTPTEILGIYRTVKAQHDTTNHLNHLLLVSTTYPQVPFMTMVDRKAAPQSLNDAYETGNAKTKIGMTVHQTA